VTEPFAADDFASIARRVRELKCEPVVAADKNLWWCPECQTEIDGIAVTYQERHDDRAGGCGQAVYPACSECDNGGWVQVYSPRPPAFEMCHKCFNPSDNPSP
jgi:hypothetical protein